MCACMHVWVSNGSYRVESSTTGDVKRLKGRCLLVVLTSCRLERSMRRGKR